MDELLHHCLRELSFDGDLGCDASRLNDFVNGFYSHLGNASAQNVDDAFNSFIWSLVVQQPTVVVGLIPEGVTSEVWIAPQTSAKRKAKASGKEVVETTPARLEPVPHARTTPLGDLKALYGNRLRIAVEPDAIFAGITGSHIRSSKLSPMVYSALQVITRGRDEGVTVVELGQKTKYDQKTCFYLVQQLTGMDLVVKVRRGGVGTHFCIHKHFYDRSPSWKAIREEENRAKDAISVKEPAEDMDDDEDISIAQSLDFTPIDSRHLSSLPLVKARVVKLLKASKNHMHASNNMLLTLGFSNPTKTDRRFFQSRIRELLQQGVIEKVIVPSSRKKSVGTAVKCFRLVSETGNDDVEGAVVVEGEDDKEEDEVGGEAGVKASITIHKQILDLLEEAGATGMTLNELSTALNNFDKRTIELLLARAEKANPPPHLADLGIAGLMETSGRERRHRYYTVSSYQQLVASEQLDDASAQNNVDLAHVGGFYDLPANLFYQNVQECYTFQDTFTRESKSAKKPRQYKNPILPDGSVKQGRPRKHPVDGAKSTAKKRKKSPAPGGDGAGAEDADSAPPPPKKRGRPRKDASVAVQSTDGQPSAENAAGDSVSAIAAPAPKKRGRPPKRKGEDGELSAPPPAKKPRGRKISEHPTTSVEPSQGSPSVPAVVDPIVDPSLDASPATPTVTLVESISTRTPLPRAENIQPPETPVPAPTPHPNPLTGDTPLQVSAAGGGTGRGRVNVSHLRRENEILRVIEESAGIVNIQTKEFYETHMALLETLAKDGEATSAPVGTRTDKRTVVLTIESLERRGKVKQLKTSIPTHTGLNKPATIVYLPGVEQDQLNAYLVELSHATQPNIAPSNSVRFSEPVEYGADPTTSTRGVLALQILQSEDPGVNTKERWSKNAARASQLFSQPDQRVRDILLAERTTVGQVYGLIVGKAARAREFHISTLQAILANHSPNIIAGARIVELNWFCQDMPVGDFTKFVSALNYSDQLLTFFQQGGKHTPVKDIPQDLHTMLQVGRSRCRSRILDLLEFLRDLKLVVPLKPVVAGESVSAPFITCENPGDHPTEFEVWAEKDWTPSTPNIAPTYWYFQPQAPIHLWHMSESEPPMWKRVSTIDVGAAEVYWRELQSACTESFLPDSITGAGPSEPVNAHVTVGRSLRRSVSWNAEYVLTWHQMRFLDKAVDIATGNSVLDEEDEQVRAQGLQRLCWVTSAPQDAVERHLRTTISRLRCEKDKIRAKNKELKRLKRLADSRDSIAKKAEEAKKQREEDWNALIARIHPGDPGPATTRIERVRTKFMQAGSVRDMLKWEREVGEAVKEAAAMAATKVLRFSGGRRTGAAARSMPAAASTSAVSLGNLGKEVQLPAPVVSATSSTIIAGIEALIAQQQPLLAQGVSHKRVRSKKKGDTEEPPAEKTGVRRHRFQWNKDFDELAQDASVIIRARCRNLSRLEWTALEQVFPAVPRNTVRQRLANLRDIPGNESYLRRMEDRWYELWVQHRGTDVLPDEQPESASNFELIQHLDFLRRHVDKNALRIGFGQGKSSKSFTIPNTVDDLLARYNVTEDVPQTTTWDFVWNAIVEEGREKRLLSLPFVEEDEGLPPQKIQENDGISLGEASLKMVMGSPPETYDCDAAADVLRSVGNDVITAATQSLLSRGVLSKSQRDPTKQKPGRMLKISDNNQNAIGGSIPRDAYQDATSLFESAQLVNEWGEWPLTATDGDAITMIHLVANNQVQFKVDTTHAQGAREGLDWNSKRADDDQIETVISVQYALPQPSDQGEQDENNMDIELEDDTEAAIVLQGHGVTENNLPACCRKSSERGIVSCAACLQESYRSLEEILDVDQKRVLGLLVAHIRGAGKRGCSKNSLKKLDLDDQVACVTLHKAAEADVPLLYWVGYASLRLIAAEHTPSWSVVISEQPHEQVFPRRWLSIMGEKIPDYWQAALRAVSALPVFRPGISQAEIRWRLRTVYDRQEVLEILAYLQMEGHLTLKRSESPTSSWSSLCPLDDDEEKTAFWFVGEKCWFQL